VSFNPFEHIDELVFSNLPGGPPFQEPPRETVTLWDGQVVPAAIPGDPSTLTLYLMSGGHQQAVTNAQGFAQELWLQYAYGADVETWLSTMYDGLGIPHQPGYHLTDTDLKAAILATPTLLGKITGAGFTEQQVLDYAHAVAPEVMIVGQPLSA
jgi:hypothetical protein